MKPDSTTVKISQVLLPLAAGSRSSTQHTKSFEKQQKHNQTLPTAPEPENRRRKREKRASQHRKKPKS
uniref:Uncharacterized protein n=1 Tax=Triticum urartu TaxID=4572 RepID=A0A8R7PMS6_TRIUA